METMILDFGYPGLFVLAFLAATILPIGSEWMLATLLLVGYDPVLSVGVATVGNSLGALTTYAIGVWGGPWLIANVLRISPTRRQQAERFYARYGIWSLLLSWLPIVGDPLCLVGGLMRVQLLHYSVLVTIGKYVRYQTVAWMVLASM